MPFHKVVQWLRRIIVVGVVSIPLVLASCGREDSEPPAGATETAVAGRVLATLTAEAQATPTLSAEVEATVQEAFETWARGQGEPFRDVVVTAGESDGFFALARMIAWFRPGRDAPWEE